mgnify:CR=1 FL=1
MKCSLHSQRRISAAWWEWLQAVSLEAPLIAVLWLAALARAHGLRLMPEVYAGLGLAVWAVYLADRCIDAAKWPAGVPWTTRHSVCATFAPVLRWFILPTLACVLAWLALFRVPQILLWQSLSVAVLAAAYLIRHAAGQKYPASSRQEIAKAVIAALLFALGIAVGVYAHEYRYPAWAILAGQGLLSSLFALNLTGISIAERAASTSRAMALRKVFACLLLLLCAGSLAVWLSRAEGVRPLRLLAAATLGGALLMALLQSCSARLTAIAYRCFADAALVLSAGLLWWLASS